ncbi:MAG: nickel pincer cofactor biosynthesis protein LarC [Kiritimatiellae bacterium]|nr:nickel pincer cofactor biosynthesis protein LarC [Kiritimatiellia bacterium]
MKTIYFDCRTGAAGDMITAALLELVPDRAASLARLNAAGLDGVSVKASDAVRGGMKGTAVKVAVRGETEDGGAGRHHGFKHGGGRRHHHHSSLGDVLSVIDRLCVSGTVKEHSKAVYSLVAAAEAKAHGKPVGEVHFHEVGAMDAVCDVVSAAMLLEEISPDEILAARPEVGGGFVRCAHGLLPVPAPATVNILEGVEFSSGAAESELLTPTGAALLKHFARGFGPMPPMTVAKTGVGCGAREIPGRPNVLRVFLGERNEAAPGANGRVTELKANIDDMTGEELAYACGRLRAAGALDVATAPIFMKKGRPAQMLVVLARPEDADAMAAAILRETSTFGVRRADLTRYELERRTATAADGVREKTGRGYGVEKTKREFDDAHPLVSGDGIC